MHITSYEVSRLADDLSSRFLADLAKCGLGSGGIFLFDVPSRQQPAIEPAVVYQKYTFAVRTKHHPGTGDMPRSESLPGEWGWGPFQQRQRQFPALLGLSVTASLELAEEFGYCRGHHRSIMPRARYTST